jgi:hypothetical protein
MCEFMDVSCFCCQKLLKRYKDTVCSKRKCILNKVVNYYNERCNKCVKKCLENICSTQDPGSNRIVYTIFEKTKYEKFVHFFGFEHFFRYRNSNFGGLKKNLRFKYY